MKRIKYTPDSSGAMNYYEYQIRRIARHVWSISKNGDHVMKVSTFIAAINFCDGRI